MREIEDIQKSVDDALIRELLIQCPDVCNAIDKSIAAGGTMQGIQQSIMRGLEKSRGNPDSVFTAEAIRAYAKRRFVEIGRGEDGQIQ